MANGHDVMKIAKKATFDFLTSFDREDIIIGCLKFDAMCLVSHDHIQHDNVIFLTNIHTL